MENRYNASSLDEEPRAKGLEIHGCSSTGRIDWQKTPTRAELKKAEAVLKCYNPKDDHSKSATLEALRRKRRQGEVLSTQETQETIDLLLGA